MRNTTTRTDFREHVPIVYPSSLLVYHAGTARIVFVAGVRLTGLFVLVFFGAVVAPPYYFDPIAETWLAFACTWCPLQAFSDPSHPCSLGRSLTRAPPSPRRRCRAPRTHDLDDRPLCHIRAPRLAGMGARFGPASAPLRSRIAVNGADRHYDAAVCLPTCHAGRGRRIVVQQRRCGRGAADVAAECA